MSTNDTHGLGRLLGLCVPVLIGVWLVTQVHIAPGWKVAENAVLHRRSIADCWRIIALPGDGLSSDAKRDECIVHYAVITQNALPCVQYLASGGMLYCL